MAAAKEDTEDAPNGSSDSDSDGLHAIILMFCFVSADDGR